MGDYTLEQALALASENAGNTLDDAIHVNIDTREITVPQSQQLFGVESDDEVEIKHIVIDGRYADGNRDLSRLSWRVIYRNANKETSYYLIPSVVANENSIEMDWLIKRSVVAYKGTVDFILCAFATTSSREVTPEWNTTLGQGTVLEGLETSAIDIGKESVDELAKILYETIVARDAAATSASAAAKDANSIKASMAQISENKEAVSKLKDDLGDITTKVVSKNIFFSEWTEAGQSINMNTGEDLVDNESHRTGYVEVEANTTYTMSTNFGKAPSVYVFFYDENKNFLSRYNTPYGFYPKTFTTPENTKYFRVRQGYQAMPTNFQVEKGSVATDYEAPYVLKKVPYSALLGAPNLDEYVKSNNSKNIGFVWESGGLNYDTGQEVASDAMMRTKFIEVSPNKTYAFSYQEYKKHEL